jgi:choline dehydrogenase-like flavoprotein
MAGQGISAEEFVHRSFSYIIVGGGTAGLVVASRLSEDPDITVGILEAGDGLRNDAAINVPGRYGEGIGTDYDWQYQTTAQSGLGGRKLPWPRGKVLGGTSALNFMTWNRPNREDLDAWAELGNDGWGWDDVL